MLGLDMNDVTSCTVHSGSTSHVVVMRVPGST